MGLVTFQFPHLNCKIEVSQLYLNFIVVSDFTITFPPGLKIDFFSQLPFQVVSCPAIQHKHAFNNNERFMMAIVHKKRPYD